MFFDSLDNRAASLSDIKVVAIFTGYLIYCVARAMIRSWRLVGVEYGHALYSIHYIYLSQKQLPRRMKSRLVIISARAIFW